MGEIPELPYDGTSGFSGSDSSEKRARERDKNGTTKNNQLMVLEFLIVKKEYGATWKEIADRFDWHHGTASSVLSNLHFGDHVSRLQETRNGCKVYVLSKYVQDKKTEVHGGKKSKIQKCWNCGVNL